MPFCTECGNKVELSWKNCPHCGKQILSSGVKDLDLSNAMGKSSKQKSITSISAAPKSRRIAAALIDLLISGGLTYVGYSFILKKSFFSTTKLRWMLFRAALLFIPAIYLLIRDSLGGKSFGKLIMNITTIKKSNGKSAGFIESLLRNSILSIIAIPILGWISFAVISVFIAAQIFMGREQRFGDNFADTIVIDDRDLPFG